MNNGFGPAAAYCPTGSAHVGRTLRTGGSRHRSPLRREYIGSTRVLTCSYIGSQPPRPHGHLGTSAIARHPDTGAGWPGESAASSPPRPLPCLPSTPWARRSAVNGLPATITFSGTRPVTEASPVDPAVAANAVAGMPSTRWHNRVGREPPRRAPGGRCAGKRSRQELVTRSDPGRYPRERSSGS